ncbi:hypothetical protein LOD99_10583 [Oopsacas minuta]|uniref:von Willebrand factor A domain-containing protein 5A-like n=1 Tax=Oopsacas minuta TaxID=111878 RepID=A0AAV7KGW9_9METZ|nr:hypothetical protein LOD99_10583 [Oopsacas minuta]
MHSKKKRCICGLMIYPYNLPPRSLPLKRVELRIESRCVLASIEAVLVYENDESSPVEVEFVMPLDSVAVVTGLSAQLDGRVVKGEVKGKEEAKDDYDDAMSSGQTALYGQQEDKDLFRMLLGNLSAGGRAELKLSLLQEMQREEGTEEGAALRLSLPNTLKPKYTPITTGSTTGADSMSGEGVTAKYELSIAMRLTYTGGLSRVESLSHKISTGVLEGGVWQVQLIDPNPLEKDLVVLLYPTEPAVPAVSWGGPSEQTAFEEKSIDKQKHQFSVSPALMLSFMPHFSQEEIEGGQMSSEIIFMIDRSGSMQGEAIASARATLELLLRSLSPGCAFNVVGFGTFYRLLFSKGSRQYNSDSLAEATKYASKMQADMMGTVVLTPLEIIYGMPQVSGLSRQVILLTDGAVSNTGEVLTCVRNNCSKARIFTIGIGSGVSSELVRGMAEAGKGRAVFVREGERMQGKILKLMSDAMSPCFTDVTLTKPSGVHLFPSHLPILFPNDRLVVYGIVPSIVSLQGQTISLSYKYKDKKFSHELSLECDQLEGEKQDWIHKLACSVVLSEWEKINSKKNECVQLSCNTNLVCIHTALVGVDIGGGKMVEGSMKHIIIKPPQPALYFPLGCSGGGGSRLRVAPRLGSAKSAIPRGHSAKSKSKGHSKRITLPPSPPGCAFPQQGSSLRGHALDSEMDLEPYGAMLSYEASDALTKADYMSLPSVPSGGSVSSHEQLISQQTADGYWEFGDIVNKILNLSEKDKELRPKGMTERHWITLLCLITLEKYSEFEDEWKLVAKKGWRWLRSCQLSINLEEAMETGRTVLK